MSITNEGIEKAAEYLFNEGQRHGWFGRPFQITTWKEFKKDQIGYSEWLDIVTTVLEKAQWTG